MKLSANATVIQLNQKPTTHLVFAAHQDDVEIMCGGGIVECYRAVDKGLAAVIVADGAGSPRAGKYANFDDRQMAAIRRDEQLQAAKLGGYCRLVMLSYASRQIKDKTDGAVKADMLELLKEYKPVKVYTHNLADKHPTHVATALNAIAAIRSLHPSERPKHLYGCEVWRDLDWLPDSDKVVFDLSGHDELLYSLIKLHDSQVSGGKQYDKAVMGRRLANATFSESHGIDKTTSATFGMDMTVLIKDDTLDIREFVMAKIEAFKKEILV